MRFLPRFNSKREIWRGGPTVDQVIQRQLNPTAGAQAEGAPAPAGNIADEPAPAPEDTSARDLLLLLR